MYCIFATLKNLEVSIKCQEYDHFWNGLHYGSFGWRKMTCLIMGIGKIIMWRSLIGRPYYSMLELLGLNVQDY
jgi:hypothetical protein